MRTDSWALLLRTPRDCCGPVSTAWPCVEQGDVPADRTVMAPLLSSRHSNEPSGAKDTPLAVLVELLRLLLVVL